ncbi:MAG: efflux RND transporter periplasmic adaptor subunit [Bacteroidales bacterium]|nr:efflux RND transporter periplasmic adaptor subunit [Bacteroidales bacterium]
MKRHLLIISLAAVATLCIASCNRKQATEQTSKIIPVKVMEIGFSEQSYSRNYVGTVEESSAVSVGFSGMGSVERVLVSEGERVKKGQLLAVLNSSTAQNAYDVAKSTLHQAQDAYDRLKPLHEKGSITEIKWIEVETGLQQAKAMEAISKKSLDDCNLYAPMDGVISKRSVEEGVNMMPGLSAFKLVSIDEVNINVPVPENEIGSIKTGQSATITVPALDNREYKGVVEKKGVEANPVSRTYALKIKVGNPKSELMPGMVCKAALLSDADGDVKKIIIPNKSVQIAPDNRKFVWLADGNTAKRRFITVGALSDYGIIVEDGLTKGDRLIVEGGSKVSEGMSLRVN